MKMKKYKLKHIQNILKQVIYQNNYYYQKYLNYLVKQYKMKKHYEKFKIKKLVDDQNIKEEIKHEPENASENEEEYKYTEERTRK